ncbi:hypothetical protein GCM10023095_06220 [Pseudaeromonas paramecii]|uniref:Uncharacterized protein n=1 Tax=Pseudaeromonas paramecii TaxID=2138166 RepID=A0ABP8Q0T8_9GAMM
MRLARPVEGLHLAKAGSQGGGLAVGLAGDGHGGTEAGMARVGQTGLIDASLGFSANQGIGTGIGEAGLLG